MTYTSILGEALADFAEDASHAGPIQQAVYAATACGGISEVALYALLAGYFRKLLERKEPSARLVMDSCFPGSSMRPDFQVHTKGSSKEPSLAVECKFVSDAGKGSGYHTGVLSAIDQDLDKLATMVESRPGLESAAVIFFLREGHACASTIEVELKQRGFRSFGAFELWRPEGVEYKAGIQLLLAVDVKVPALTVALGG
jgi:hypothetical protein